MASATFELRAVDKTQQAFASVQNSLGRLQQSAQVAGRSLTKNLDVKDVFRSLAMAAGLSADKIANKIAELVTGQDEETKKLQESLAGLGEEAIKAQAALFAATSSDETNVKRLIIERDRLRKVISIPPADLQQQVTQEQKKISLYQTEVELFQLQKKIREDQKRTEEAYQGSLEKLGAAQAKVYGDQTSVAERLIGLRGKEGKLMYETSATDIKDTERRTELNNQLAGVLEKINALQEQQARVAKEAAAAIASGFEDAIMSGMSLRDTLRAIAQDLLRLFVRQQITEPLAKGLGSLFSSSSIFSAIFGGGKAAGGPVSGGTPYVVGEKGPELFVPGSSGSIIPNHRLGSGSGGGSSVVVNYHISSGVNKAELMPILENERKRLKAEIPDMVRRGGAYRAAFA